MRLKRSTVRATDSIRVDEDIDQHGAGALLSLRWSGRISVTRRILAVNIFAVVVLAASFFYLDSYRTRLLDHWRAESQIRALLIGQAITSAPSLISDQVAMRQFAGLSAARVRVVDSQGRVIADVWPTDAHAYGYSDPASEAWNLRAARELDRIIDAIVGAPKLASYLDAVPRDPPQQARTSLTNAPDRTPMISAYAPLPRGYVVTTENAREITTTVRDERLRLGLIIAAAIILSVLLSLFLARTIVQPLRRLASAAVRVRLGRARDVTVPRLPRRSDEIGMLARALSDMTNALRARIDATESFAADVAHELKNPLASLGSAVDSLAVVQQTELKAQLINIIRGDVRRLDRLISDIAGLSRLDAQMTRTPFTRVNLAELVAQYVARIPPSTDPDTAKLSVGVSHGAPPIVMADRAQLERVVGNLAENALGFAPPHSVVRLGAYRVDAQCVLWVEDDGIGIPPSDREQIFARFHSYRPEPQPHNEHSGLGLAIVKTIVEAHNGSVVATEHADGSPGARFVVTLPAAASGQ